MLAIMLGANVGTTLIVQALSFNVTAAAPALFIVGLLAFRGGGRSRLKDIGRVSIGLGLMLLSVAAYAFVFGWRYAVGFVVLLFIHEMGHFMAARQRGMTVGAPTFIPFVGAWIDLKEQPMDVETEAHIGLAGPVAGSALRST